jgi:myo-inositol-1(or 4)-monophosphatase
MDKYSFFPAVEWGSDRAKKPMDARTGSFYRLAADPTQNPGGRMAHSIRSLGSSALNFAMVAQGGLDIYWHVSPRLNSMSVCN